MVVQQMLGYASAAMTLDVYAGLFGDDLDAVGARLARHGADQFRTDAEAPDVPWRGMRP